ncbi:MAG: NAD(P)/FAD-dependent oxidoreductase [Candidatus Aminicenantales bacterium]|jgi:geranylgeranyl reductase family protein
MPDFDAAVVGGGPSGLQTARLLAERGLRAVVFEKKSEIGADVVCTGIVGREIFHEFGLPEHSLLRDFRAMTVVGPSGRSLSYEHPSTFAAIVDRGLFDKSLAAVARQAGAEIQTGVSVVSASVSSKGVRLRIRPDRGEAVSCSASVLVLATGIHNDLQAGLGLGSPRAFLRGVQSETGPALDGEPAIYLGTGIAPGAFGWAVPTTPGRMKIGLITEKDPVRGFAGLLDALRLDGGRGEAEAAARIKPIAQGLVARTSGQRVLVVGEAAGQVKTTTGGGIYYGLLGARVASDLIMKAVQARDFRASFLSEYDRLWRAVLKREILIGHYVRKAFAALDDRQIEKLMDVARQDGVIPLVRARGHFDWQSGLIMELLRKAPVFRLFREIGRPPAFMKKFWS